VKKVVSGIAGVGGLRTEKRKSAGWLTCGGFHASKSSRAKKKRSLLLGAAAAAALAVSAGQSRAQNLYFDGDGLGAVSATSGIWDTQLINWSTTPGGPADTTWMDGSVANFNGPGGTINLASSFSLSGLSVSGGNFFFRNTLAPTFGASGTMSVNVAVGSDVKFQPAIGGSNGFVKTGGGSIGFFSNVISSGVVDIQQGTVYFAGPLGELTDSTVVNVGANGVLDLRSYNESSFGGLTGSGLVKLGGTPGYIAQTTGTLFGITYNDTSTTQEFSGTIQGFGFSGGGARFVKQGQGTFRLSGSNNQWGVTSIRGGVLEVVGGTALPDLAPVSLDLPGSTLRVLSSETIGSLGSGSNASGGLIDLGDTGTVTLTIGADGYNNVFRGSLAGSGTIVKTGAGIQTIRTAAATATTYTGKYRIEGGTLSFNSEAAMGADLGSPVADAIQLAGGTLANTTAGGMAISANRGFAVSSPSGIRVVGSGVSTITINGALSGAAGLTKTGPGVLDVATDPAALTYTGDWTVREGTLRTSRNNAIPLGTGSLDVSGATVQLIPGGSGLVAAPTLASEVGGIFSFGPAAALEVARGANTSYKLTIGNTATGSLVRNANGSLVLIAKSGVNNLGNPTTGEQVLVTGGAATTNGIVPGVFAVGDHFASTAGDFVGYDPVAGFKKATYTSTNLGTAAATNVVEQSSDVTLAGPASAYALKVGTGSGPVTVTAAGQTITLGSGMVLLNDSATISGGTVALGAAAGVFDTPGTTATLGASVTGTGGFTKLGQGTLTVAPGATLGNGGPTTIGQGTLSVSANGQLSPNADLVFTSTGGFGSTDTTGTVSRLRLNGTTQNVKLLSSDAGYLVSASTSAPPSTPYGPVIDFGVNGVLVVGSGDSTYKGGAVTDATSTSSTLWKNGTGNLTLGERQVPDNSGITSAAMSYDKLWVSGGGTVSVSSTSSIPNTPVVALGIVPDVYKLDGGTLRVTSVNIPNLVGAGGVSSSFLDVFGARRGLTIGAGGGTIEVTEPLEILLGNGATNNLYGTGTLTKTGAGIYRPSINNPNFTGKTVIKQGAIQITGELSLGTGTGTDYITLDGGTLACESNTIATWSTDRGFKITGNGGEVRVSTTWVMSGVLNGTGPIKKTGGGAWVVNGTGNAGYTGDITVINGTLDIRASAGFGTGKLIFDPVFPIIFSRGVAESETEVPNAIEFRPGSSIDIRPTSPMLLSGKVSGTGDVFKGLSLSGPNDLRFSNPANDFSGNLTALVGSVVASANGAMGSTNGATIIQGSAQFVLNDPTGGSVNYTTPEPLFIANDGNGSGAFQSLQGTNTFAGPVTLTNNTSIGVADGSLNLTGRVAGAAALTKFGSGKLTLSNANNSIGGDFTINTGPVEFNANHTLGGQLILRTGASATLTTGNRVLRTTNVQFNDPFNPDAKLDLTNGRLIVDYSDSNGTPLVSVRNAIIAGFVPGNGPHWTANGITSSTAAVQGNLGVGYAEASEVSAGGKWTGESVDGSAVVVRTTLLGDATLDGTVDFNDLVKLAQNYNTTVSLVTESWWNHGDFTYDGIVDFNDLVKLAQNYNTSLPSAPVPGAGVGFEHDLAAAFASVPEPSAALLAFFAACGFATSRRRRREK
jgi:autotransporter-associated beta strand protein